MAERLATAAETANLLIEAVVDADLIAWIDSLGTRDAIMFNAALQRAAACEREQCARIAAEYEPSEADYQMVDNGQGSAWDIAPESIALLIRNRTRASG